MRLIKEYPGKIPPFSQIQKLMKLWAVVFNREIPPRVVAGIFKETLASPSKIKRYARAEGVSNMPKRREYWPEI
jgi:hypothetical protein